MVPAPKEAATENTGEGLHFQNLEKFTQCKTSHTLKIDVFEIPDNKNIGKLFSKYEPLFLDQANFSSDASQTLILQFLELSCLPHPPSLLNHTLAN